MKWTETITPKQAAEELGVPYHGWMREMDRAWISEDQKYSVMSRLLRTEWGKVEHVTITAAEGVGRSDGSGDIPWAVKMEIKNDLFGEKRVAVEVFPTQDRLVDVCDCYHLWVFEKGFQLPFGIHPRDKKTVTVNRGSTRVRAIDGAGREHSIKELLEENGAADVPKQAYAQAMAGYMMKNLLGGRCKMWLWIVLVVLAVMAALLIYAACCVDGDIDRQSEAHPPKPEKGRDDGKV